MPRSVNYRVLTTDNRPLPTLPPAGIPVGPPGRVDRPLSLAPGGYQILASGRGPSCKRVRRRFRSLADSQGRPRLRRLKNGSDPRTLRVRGFPVQAVPARFEIRMEALGAAKRPGDRRRITNDLLARKKLRSQGSHPSVDPPSRTVDRTGSRKRRASGNRDRDRDASRLPGRDVGCKWDKLAVGRGLQAACCPGGGSLVGSGPAELSPGLLFSQVAIFSP